MAALRSAFVFQSHTISLRDRIPFVTLLPHPDPGQRILIVRTLVRMHNHGGQLQHPDSMLAVLFRASDGAPIGGAVLDSSPASTGGVSAVLSTSAFEQQDFDYTPNGFVLEPSDGLGMVASHEPRDGVIGHICSVNALIAWHRIEAKFLNVTLVPGNPSRLIGVKDDGTVWRAADATAAPLVWSQI